ncbi:hypothetical protein BJX96DRAFT_157037, partial [Aspergillus floccosus]
GKERGKGREHHELKRIRSSLLNSHVHKAQIDRPGRPCRIQGNGRPGPTESAATLVSIGVIGSGLTHQTRTPPGAGSHSFHVRSRTPMSRRLLRNMTISPVSQLPQSPTHVKEWRMRGQDQCQGIRNARIATLRAGVLIDHAAQHRSRVSGLSGETGLMMACEW